MPNIIPHIVNCSFDELKEIGKNGEVYREYPKNPDHALWDFRNFWKKSNSTVEVSNLGNIKIDGKIVVPFEKEPDYFYVTITNNVDYPVYRLVAETWCEFPHKDTVGWQVHHIDNNGKNNCPENLIWIDKTTHLHFHRNGGRHE